MFNKKKPNLETIQNLKNYFINKYEIKDKIILTAIVHRKNPLTVLVSTLFFGIK